MHLVLEREFFSLADSDWRLRFRILHNELHLGAREVTADLVQVKLEAVAHILADLGETTCQWRQEADAQFLRGARRLAHAHSQRQTNCRQFPAELSLESV